MGSLAPGLSRKLKKVLESTRTESPDLVASLNTLSSFYGENTPHSRRDLRSTIESRSLSINLDFLNASSAAVEALSDVEAEVDSLSACCDRIAAALSSCSASTADIVSATARLKSDLLLTSSRQRVVSAFLRDFQLSPAEIAALRGSDADSLGPAFFSALSHVQEIHANCKTLLRTHHQRAGLELMDAMAAHQEAAYERVCRWVQAECRKLGDADNPEVGAVLRQAVACLRDRPLLLKYCTEEVAGMRHNALFRRFITALTRGGPNSMPRPIEVHAHDPLRYVQHMLAWLHQALASEREFVTLLLDPENAHPLPPLRSDHKLVLDRIFQGVCRPFKVRVEQVFQSHPSLIVSYKLANTLDFYCHTISELLGTETALSDTLARLKEAGYKSFFEILKSRGEKLVRYPALVAVDLSAPAAVREAVSLLLEIIDTHNTSMAPASGVKPEFDPVVSALLDPVIQMCEQAAEKWSRRESSAASSSTSAHVFLINCLCSIREPLAGHEAASQYSEKLVGMIEHHARAVVVAEVEGILVKCNLQDKMDRFAEGSREGLAEKEETSPAAVGECLNALFKLLLGSESSLPEFQQIQLPKLRSEACVQVARSLAEAYELIYDAVVDPTSGYPDPKSLARHPPHQIRTILGI